MQHRCNNQQIGWIHIRFWCSYIAHTVSVLALSMCLVVARLDYCNSLLHGTWESNLAILQHVQNSLASVVLQIPWRSCSKSSLMMELHWLPIAEHIDYKIAMITYKTRMTNQPAYLRSVLKEYQPAKTLHSENHCSWKFHVETHRQQCVVPVMPHHQSDIHDNQFHSELSRVD